MGSALKLDAQTREALEKVARRAGKSAETIARTAVREFVEDYWDMLEVKRRARSRAKAIPWSDVKKQLGLER
jgi:predicted transcriptional regulator